MLVSLSEKTALSRIHRILKRGLAASPRDLLQLASCLQHPSVEVRLLASTCLYHEIRPGNRLTEALMKGARVDSSLEVRTNCVRALGTVGLDLQPYVDMKAGRENRDPDYDSDDSPRYRAIRNLLAEIASLESEPEILRSDALLELGALGDDPAARDSILPFLDHPSSVLRAAAAEAVGLWRSLSHGVDARILALMEDPHEDVQRAAMIACGKLKVQAAVDPLRRFCTSSNGRLRGAALIGFANCGPLEEAASLLEPLAGTSQAEDPLFDDIQVAKCDLGLRMDTASRVTDYDGEDAPDEDSVSESIRHIEGFLKHEGAEQLSSDQRADLAFVAEHFQYFLARDVGTPLESIDRSVVQEYLLDFYPRRSGMSSEEASRTPAMLARFLLYLGTEGLLSCAEELADFARSLQGDFDEALSDPSTWGFVKSIVMLGPTGDVDLDVKKEMERLTMSHDAEQATQGLPGAKQTPKVGRNDPCPCGSGKKFKNCCG